MKLTKLRPLINGIPGGLFVVITFMALVLLTNAEWLAIDHRPPRWDESENLILTEVAYQRLGNFDWAHLFISNGTARLNFIPILSALLFPIIGREIDTTIFVLNSASLVLTSICLYDIGRRLLTQTAGILAVIIYNTMPGIALFSRYYHMDITLAAFVTATVWLAVIYIETPSWRAWIALLLGAFVAMGMAVKHLYPIYVILSLGWMLIVLLRESGPRLLTFLRQHNRLIISLGTGIILGAVYIVVLNYQGFTDGILRSFLPGKSALATIGFVPPSIIERLRAIEDFEFGQQQWFWWLLLFGTFCAMVFFLRRLTLIWCSLIGASFFLLFVLRPTDSTYFIATMPFAALLMASFAALPRRLPKLRFVTMTLAIFIGVMCTRAYLKSSLDTNSPLAPFLGAPAILWSSKPLETNPVADTAYWTEKSASENYPQLPNPRDWPIKKVLEAVRDQSYLASTGGLTIGLFSNYEWFNGHAFEYWTRRLEMDTRFSIFTALPPLFNEPPERFFSRFDVLILKTGQVLPHMRYSFAHDTQSYFEGVTRDDYAIVRNVGWQLINRWPLPDGSEATAWRSADISKLRLTRMMSSAISSHDLPGYITPWQGEIGGEFRRAVFLHPRNDDIVSSLTWRQLLIPDKATQLSFGIGFAQESCGNDVPPVRFRITITEDSHTNVIFDHVLHPRPCGESRWEDFAVSLQPWQGKHVDLAINTVPAVGKSNYNDHVVWSGLEIH